MWLTLERGTSTMSFPISVVSNQPLSAQHFQEWDKQCRKDGRPLTMQSEAADITRRLKAAEKYVLAARQACILHVLAGLAGCMGDRRRLRPCAATDRG